MEKPSGVTSLFFNTGRSLMDSMARIDEYFCMRCQTVLEDMSVVCGNWLLEFA